MKHVLRIGLTVVAFASLLAGCQLGDRVEDPGLPPNTFILPGFPEENQTWLSDAVAFSFFGADPDNEIVAFYTKLEPGLIDTLVGGVIDTLWPGEAGYYDPTPDSVVSSYDWQRTENEGMQYTGIADAYYRFSVRSVDESSFVDPFPARRHFLVLAATFPEIVIDDPPGCPPPKDAPPTNRIFFHGELGTLESHEFEYTWMLSSDDPNDPLTHQWLPWQRALTEAAYAGMSPGVTYTWRVKCRIERGGVFIESRGFVSCEFTIRSG